MNKESELNEIESLEFSLHREELNNESNFSFPFYSSAKLRSSISRASNDKINKTDQRTRQPKQKNKKLMKPLSKSPNTRPKSSMVMMNRDIFES